MTKVNANITWRFNEVTAKIVLNLIVKLIFYFILYLLKTMSCRENVVFVPDHRTTEKGERFLLFNIIKVFTVKCAHVTPFGWIALLAIDDTRNLTQLTDVVKRVEKGQTKAKN